MHGGQRLESRILDRRERLERAAELCEQRRGSATTAAVAMPTLRPECNRLRRVIIRFTEGKVHADAPRDGAPGHWTMIVPWVSNRAVVVVAPRHRKLRAMKFPLSSGALNSGMSPPPLGASGDFRRLSDH